MKVLKIRILNFRSIINQHISFPHQAMALIGLNESGKSNILAAIKAFDESYIFSYKDKSKLTDELPEMEIELELSDSEISDINGIVEKHLKETVVSENPILFEFVNLKIVKKKLRITSQGAEFLKEVELEYSDFKLLNEVYWIEAPEKILLGAKVSCNGEDKDITFGEFYDARIVPEAHREIFSHDFNKILQTAVHGRIKEYLNKKIHVIKYWEYSNRFLMPSEITYDEFIQGFTPHLNSQPLYNIFLLSKELRIKNPQDLLRKIEIWKKEPSDRRRDASIINDSINRYVKGIWSDYDQDLRIELEEFKITIHVNDPKSQQKNYYDMEARSQGFKTFISFILTLAAEVENGIISNFILLLDEPEIHLHPSGVRYMRDQLLKLCGTNNYVIYSTHSIFMIDRAILKRHIIVLKDNEVTKLKYVERNNFIQESVIYEAMGTSLSEMSIGNKNLVFEGELDLKLFEFYVKEIAEKESVKLIRDYDFWDGGGTKQIWKFLFENRIIPRDSKWVVILDKDIPGRELHKNISKLGLAHCEISTSFYDEHDNYEIEDILPRSIIQRAFDLTSQEIGITDSNVNFTTDQRIVSAITGDFKRVALDKEMSIIFEEKFKQSLDEVVHEELDAIKQMPAEPLADKQNAFGQKFPDYLQFANRLLKEKFSGEGSKMSR